MTVDPVSEVFRQEWTRHYGALPPLAWMLRESGGLPWVRFHALPQSKRHAEDDAERRTILDRGNALGDRLLGPGTACWLVWLAGDDDAEGVFAGSFVDDADDSFEWRYRVEAVEWRSGAFDTKLMEIAEDAERALWVSRSSGVVFAPYDGGFDLFPRSHAEAAVLKADHVDWLSERPDGL